MFLLGCLLTASIPFIQQCTDSSQERVWYITHVKSQTKDDQYFCKETLFL